MSIPELIIPIIRWHLSCFAQDGDEGLVFTSPPGIPLQHSRFRQRVWVPALKAAGLTGVHFHDLRHTGNTLAMGAVYAAANEEDSVNAYYERPATIDPGRPGQGQHSRRRPRNRK